VWSVSLLTCPKGVSGTVWRVKVEVSAWLCMACVEVCVWAHWMMCCSSVMLHGACALMCIQSCLSTEWSMPLPRYHGEPRGLACFAFVHSHLALPPSEEQCREDRIAAELSKQRTQHLRGLAGSSFEDPVRNSCKGRGVGLSPSFVCAFYCSHVMRGV